MIRLKHPNLFYGSMTYAAHMKPIVNFKSHMEITGNVVQQVYPKCHKEIKKATAALDFLIEEKKVCYDWEAFWVRPYHI